MTRFANGKCEREESRMSPRFLTYATASLPLPFTKMSQIIVETDFRNWLGSDVLGMLDLRR